MTDTTIDRARLDSWLTANLPGWRGPIDLEKFEGGQSNPTFRLRAGSGDYVLRRKPPGALLASAHAVDREFRVLAALGKTGVPVPHVHALCQDVTVIGSDFYLMDFLPGRIFWDPRLPGLEPADRAAMFDSLNATIAALHSVDWRAAGLEDYGRPGNYLSRQIGRWSKQYRASETQSIEAMDRLIDWLPTRIPEADETAIVHGDYRIDNVIYHPTEPRVIGVLDWELSTLGDPLVDFAYNAMAWRFSPDLFRGLAGADLATLGIPSEEEYVAAYCRRTGRDGVKDWEYYIVFSMFRIAAILQGVYKRGLDGNAASAQALEVGAKTRPIAEQAWELARSLG